MNQILMTNDEKGNSLLGINPIIKFFAIVIIVLGVIFIGEGGYKLYSSLNAKKDIQKPTLNIEKNGSAVVLNIEDQTAINKVYYAWNDGNENELKGDGKRKVNYEIEMPQGNNILNVYVIDVEGNKTKFNGVNIAFTSDEDTIKPKIAITKSENAGKIIITATDNEELDYITYKWQNGEEVTVKATENGQKEIKQEVAVQKGTNSINCVAYDKAGNDETYTMKIVGSDGAKISVKAAEGNFVVKVTSESEITKIIYTHNDKEETINNIPKGTKEYEFKVQLQDGVNLLKINAFENDVMTEYKCKKTKN